MDIPLGDSPSEPGRVQVNVDHVLSVVRFVSNEVFREAWLPYRKMGLKLHADFPRRTSLDILDRPLKTDDLARGKQDVNVVGHDDVAVKAVSSLVTAVKDFLFDDSGPIGLVKERATLPSGRGNEVGSGLRRAMLGTSHAIPQAGG
jgi:hypothetical protein